MVASAPTHVGRGSVDPALLLKNQVAGPDDSRPTRTEGDHREVPEAALRAEALDADAKWQSAIDAATD